MNAIEAWAAAHPALVGTVLFLTLSAVANWLMRFETPEQWEWLKENHPRIAGLISSMRALGLDPVKLLRAAIAITSGRWPSALPKDPK